MSAARSAAVSTRTLVVYGAGAVGPGIIFALQGFYLLYFYTDVARIPVATVTLGLAFSRVWDIVNDPLVGWVSDKTQGRWGRRRGFLLFGAVPLAVTTYLVFAIPSGMTGLTALGALVVTYFLWDLAITAVHVPFVALGGELTDDYDGRTRVVAFAAGGAIAGYLVAGIGTPLLAGDGDGGYRVVGLVLGALAGLAVMGAGFWVGESAETRDVSMPIVDTVRRALANHPFRLLVAALALVRVAFTATSAVLPFFVVHHLGESEESVGSLIGVLLASVVIGIPVWRRVAARSNKHRSYAVGLGITAIGLGLVMAVPEGGLGAAAGIIAVIGFGNAAHWLLPWSMIPDAVDFSGDTDSLGLYFGVYGVAEKVTRSLALVAVSGALGLFGYVAGSDPGATARIGIRLMVGPIPGLFVAAAIPFVLRYPIGRSDRESVRNPDTKRHRRRRRA